MSAAVATTQCWLCALHVVCAAPHLPAAAAATHTDHLLHPGRQHACLPGRSGPRALHATCCPCAGLSRLAHKHSTSGADQSAPDLQGQDLATGNLTAPAVYALQTAVGPELGRLIKGGFDDDETGTNLMQALHLVAISGGIDRSRELARQEADMVSAA